MSASLIPSGTGRAISQFTTCAESRPMTIVSWLIDTSCPRMARGATSAMYIGERFDASPMATPPVRRHARNTGNEFAAPVPIDVMAKMIADTIRRRLRPNLSLSAPEATAPNRQPIKALLIAQPISAGVCR